MLVIGGRHMIRRELKGGLQEMDQTPLLHSVTKLAATAWQVDRLADYVAIAARHAFDGRGGPVLLDVPMDVQFDMVEETAIRMPRAYRQSSGFGADEPAIDRIVSAMKDVDRVMVFAGAGSRGQVHDRLAELAEILEAPTYVNGRARGHCPRSPSARQLPPLEGDERMPGDSGSGCRLGLSRLIRREDRLRCHGRPDRCRCDQVRLCRGHRRLVSPHAAAICQRGCRLLRDRLGLPIIGVVGKDGVWSNIKTFHRMAFPEGLVATDLGVRPYHEMVTGLGGYGEFVDHPNEIRPALERARESGLPSLVNVHIAETMRMPSNYSH